MDDSVGVVATGSVDDIIARIMREIEDVIGLIQAPMVAERKKKILAPITDEAAPATAVAA